MDVRRRPLRPEELSRIDEVLVTSAHWGRMVVPALGVGIAAMLGAIAVTGLPGLGGAWTGMTAPGILVATTGVSLLAFVIQSRRRTRRANQHYDADRRAGYVEEWRAGVRGVIRVDHHDDEPDHPRYFLGLDDGRVLFLAGDYLSPLESMGRFPCTELRLARLPHSGAIVDIECHGDPLTASIIRPPFTVAERLSGAVPENGVLLEGPISRFRRARK